MESYKIQILESVIVFFTFVTIKLLIKYFVRMTVLNSYFKNVERKDILKIINLFLFVIFCIIMIAIWSVKQSQILVFLSSILTVLGVALFAEMSILSNLTACVILFFQSFLETIPLRCEKPNVNQCPEIGLVSECTESCLQVHNRPQCPSEAAPISI